MALIETLGGVTRRIGRDGSPNTSKIPDSDTSLSTIPELRLRGKGFIIINRKRVPQGPNEGFPGEVPQGIKIEYIGRGIDEKNPYGDFIASRTGDLQAIVERFRVAPEIQTLERAKEGREARMRRSRKAGRDIVAIKQYPGGVAFVAIQRPQAEPAPIGVPIGYTARQIQS